MNKEFRLINKTYKGTHRPYADRVEEIHFEFDRKITEKEFIEFLHKNDYTIYCSTGWWDADTTLIEHENVWVYKTVYPYCD